MRISQTTRGPRCDGGPWRRLMPRLMRRCSQLAAACSGCRAPHHSPVDVLRPGAASSSTSRRGHPRQRRSHASVGAACRVTAPATPLSPTTSSVRHGAAAVDPEKKHSRSIRAADLVYVVASMPGCATGRAPSPAVADVHAAADSGATSASGASARVPGPRATAEPSTRRRQRPGRVRSAGGSSASHRGLQPPAPGAEHEPASCWLAHVDRRLGVCAARLGRACRRRERKASISSSSALRAGGATNSL